ncbi:MAG: cell division protein FtsW [Actinomycetota bacterium]
MSTTEPRRTTPSIADRRKDMLHRLGLDEKHRMPLKPPTTAFYGILVVVSLFTALGLIMVLSSSSITSLHSGESAWRLFRRQTLWAMVGIGAMWAVYKIPYQNWRRPQWLLPIILSSLLLNAVVPVVGRDINGARAWLQWGAFRLQPSEFMKIATIMYCAHYLTRRHRYVAVKEEVLKRMLTVMVVTCFLCVAQRDFGTALVFASIILVMMLIIGVPMTQMAATVGLVGALGILVITQADNASRRLLAFTDLEGTKSLDSRTAGWAARASGREQASGATCRSPTATSSSRSSQRNSGWSGPFSSLPASWRSCTSGCRRRWGRGTCTAHCSRAASPRGSRSRQSSTSAGSSASCP